MLHLISVAHMRDFTKHGANAVRIDRKTVFGNPFPMNLESERAEVIAKYKLHLWHALQDPKSDLGKQVRLLAAAKHDLVLCCWCAPLPCHGDVLKAAIEWLRATATPVREPIHRGQLQADELTAREIQRMRAETASWVARCAAEDQAAEDQRIAELWAIRQDAEDDSYHLGPNTPEELARERAADLEATALIEQRELLATTV